MASQSEASSLAPSPVGTVRLASSLRIAPKENAHAHPAPDGSPTTAEGATVGQGNAAAVEPKPPLAHEELQALWTEAMAFIKEKEPEAFKLLADREVRVGEGETFCIVADSSLLDQELRPYKVEILEWMRHRAHRPRLNCRVIVEYVEHEKLIYAPRDKYEAMVAKNPTLETFHVLFPEIDY